MKRRVAGRSDAYLRRRAPALEALATGCRLELAEGLVFSEMLPDVTLADRFRARLEPRGYRFRKPGPPSGSSDIGNVSYAWPAIRPAVTIAPDGTGLHTEAFREAAGSPAGVRAMLDAAYALAATAADFFADAGLRAAVREECERRLAAARAGRQCYNGAEACEGGGPLTRAEQHERTLELVRRLVDSPRPLREIGGDVVAHLRASYAHYHWVGLYMVEGGVLRLWHWDGPAHTEHTEIPLQQGICGWAASTGEIANVPDVRSDPRYLACFASTRSELVVPIRAGDVVYGEIDIDSDLPAAFGAADEALLSAVCELLADKARRDGIAGRRLGAAP